MIDESSEAPVRVYRTQGGSILTFRPNLPAAFTESLTLEAMRRLGITAQELEYPSEVILNEYSRNPRARQVARRLMVQQADALILEVRRMREALILQRETEAAAQESEDQDSHVFVTELGIIEQMQARERRNVESLVIGILKQQQMEQAAVLRQEQDAKRQLRCDREQRQRRQANEEAQRCMAEKRERKERERAAQEEQQRQAAAEREAEKQQRIEEEKQQKGQAQEDEEKRRRILIAAVRQRIQERDEAKRQETLERMAHMEEREARYQQRLNERQREAEAERQRKQQKMEERQRRLRQADDRRAEEKIRDAEKRQEHVEQKLCQLEQERERDKLEAREQDRERAEKKEQLRRQREQDALARADEIQQKEEHAMQRYLEHEHAKQERIANAMRSYVENQQKVQEKQAQMKREEDEKNNERLRALQERDEKLRKQQEDAEEARALAAVDVRVKQRQKAQAAARAERKREADKELLKQKFDEKLRRIEAIQRDQNQMRAMTMKKRQELKQEHAVLVSQIEAIQMMDSTRAPSAMKELAARFGIDIDELKAKVDERHQPLPPLHSIQPPPAAQSARGQNPNRRKPQRAQRAGQLGLPQIEIPA
jgi:hypothetical protein